MNIKRFRGDTVPDALAKVKAEFGSGAVILSTRTVTEGGFLGFFGRTLVEVTAAADEPARRRQNGRSQEKVRPSGSQTSETDPAAARYRQRLARRAYKQQEKATVANQGPGADGQAASTSPANGRGPGNDEEETGTSTTGQEPAASPGEPVTAATVAEQGAAVNSAGQGPATRADQSSGSDQGLAANSGPQQTATAEPQEPRLPAAQAEEPLPSEEPGQPSLPQQVTAPSPDHLELERVDDILQLHELRQQTWEALGLERLLSPGYLQVDWAERWRSHVWRGYHLVEPSKPGPRQRWIALVGPTGAGKTTTIAKLAAHFSLNEAQSVALIAADTYRMGAVEQLRAYADILDLPLTVVYSAGEMETAARLYRETDVVLVDTAGRNHLDDERMVELKELLAAAAADEVHLALNAGMRLVDAQAAVERYLSLGVNRLLLTKLDETRSRGLPLNLLAEYGLPFSYVTYGQGVPDDIDEANPLEWLEMIAGGDQVGSSNQAAGTD